VPAALEVTHLRKEFVLGLNRKKVRAVDDLTFRVEEESIVGFLGANGAGKTTTIKMIMGLIFADSGEVKVFGRPIGDISIKKQIGFLTERPYFYDYLSGREFLTFCADLFGDPETKSRIEPLFEEVGLAKAADRSLRHYSKGMLQRIGIAQALINNPKLLILDEPMSGLDPDGRAEISKIIRRAHGRGATVIFSTHLLPDVENLCDRVVIINKGKLVIESPVSDLLNSYAKGFILELQDAKQTGSEIIRREFTTEDELQKALKDAVSSGKKVVKVAAARPSLEEVFIQFQKRDFKEESPR